MENNGIKEVVEDFNALIDKVISVCSDEVADKLIIASQAMLKDLLPDKYFVQNEKALGTDILIFDSKDARDKWISSKKSSAVSPIEFYQVEELSEGEWDDLTNYKTTPNGELILKVW